MAVHKNSLHAYHNEVLPHLTKRQLQVLKVMQKVCRATNQDLYAITGQTNNVIAPRTGELRDLGYIKEAGDRKIGTRLHTIYEVTDLGMSVDTEEVRDLIPKERYYSYQDRDAVMRDFYDFVYPKLAAKPLDELKGLMHSYLNKYEV